MIIEKILKVNLAKQYKELLRNSYQTLNDKDKKLIRLAFDTADHAAFKPKKKVGELYPIFSSN